MTTAEDIAAAVLSEHDRLTKENARLREALEADKRELTDMRAFLHGVARQLTARAGGLAHAALRKETT